ncbi:MAG: YicC/YloC family endoribonuclease, partial [Oscillospiraceae bacterium]
MLKSMTGFGRAEQIIDSFDVKVQVKSVNHRYSDLLIRIPRSYNFLEDKIRQTVNEYISRGKIEVSIEISRSDNDDRSISINEPLAKGYIDALKQLTLYDVVDDLSISSLSRFNDIFNVEYKKIDEEELSNAVFLVLNDALLDFVKMRTAEGGRLEENIKHHLLDILKTVSEIEILSPKSVEEYRQKLKNRLLDILADTTIDESRILTEAAIFADKIAVDEETVRLRSHINEFENAIKTDKPVAKKLDFIIQEMNRETNTIGSKANDFK